MRGTLFVTTPDWLAGLLQLTGERTARQMARRRGELGLDDATVERAAGVAADRIADGPVSRAEMLAVWQAAGIGTAGGPGYHLIVLLAVRALWHWGPFVDGEQCLVATPARPADGDPDRVLADVVAGYVRAHGPATPEDAAWWLKLPLGQVRRALGRCPGLVEVEVAGSGSPHVVDQGLLDGLGDLPATDGSVLLLPAFDEYYLGYQRRDLVASAAMQQAVVPGGNGVFRPLVVVDGRVVGTWGRGRAGAELRDLVEPLPTSHRRAVEEALAAVVP